MQESFRKIATHISNISGTAGMFLLALSGVFIWPITGPVFNFSNTWQLVINTTTTIITFLMVFLIQNTQNRDSRAMHLKLDELIKAMGGARNSLLNIEELSDAELDHLQDEFRQLQTKYLTKFQHRGHLKLVVDTKITQTTKSTRAEVGSP